MKLKYERPNENMNTLCLWTGDFMESLSSFLICLEVIYTLHCLDFSTLFDFPNY